MRFIINKPSVWMYKTDNLCGEVSDELLYGTVLEIILQNWIQGIGKIKWYALAV